MTTDSNTQSSFFDTSYICDSLVPQDSFYRKFREIVGPIIKEKHFEDMYCGENGRPPISSKLMIMAMLIQSHRNLSDREMERACMYDIEVKYALGLKLNERPFDHSSLGDFRKRLLQNEKEKEVFDRILKQLIKKGLIEENEIQRIDSTHVIADIAIPTMVTFVKKGVFEVLKHLSKTNSKIEAKIRKEIQSAEYSKEQVNHVVDGRLDIEKRQQKLVSIVYDAKKVLKEVEPLEKSDSVLKEHADILRRILQENVREDENGNPKERPMGKGPPDMLASPVDKDARFGAKSRTKRFVGYKATITESVKNRFITNVSAMPGNWHDGRPMIETVKEQKKFGLIPKKLIGDTAYGHGENRKELKDHGTRVVAPLGHRNARTEAVYPKSMFKYNSKKKKMTCPEGVTTGVSFRDHQRDIEVYHFPMSACGICPKKSECTNSKDNRRTVGVHRFHKVLLKAERFNRTKSFGELMKLRQPIEGKISELKRYHGLTRAKYRGIKKVGLQFIFAAAAVNVKRWIKVVTQQNTWEMGLA